MPWCWCYKFNSNDNGANVRTHYSTSNLVNIQPGLTCIPSVVQLLVPTPRLRHGLFNQVVPPYGFGAPDLKLCCNAEGVKHYGVPVPLKSNLKVSRFGIFIIRIG